MIISLCYILNSLQSHVRSSALSVNPSSHVHRNDPCVLPQSWWHELTSVHSLTSAEYIHALVHGRSYFFWCYTTYLHKRYLRSWSQDYICIHNLRTCSHRPGHIVMYPLHTHSNLDFGNIFHVAIILANYLNISVHLLWIHLGRIHTLRQHQEPVYLDIQLHQSTLSPNNHFCLQYKYLHQKLTEINDYNYLYTHLL